MFERKQHLTGKRSLGDPRATQPRISHGLLIGIVYKEGNEN